MAVAILVLCCLSLVVAGAIAYYFDWKKRKEEEEEAENRRFLNQPVPKSTESSSPATKTDCQSISNNNLTWSGHRGLAELETWGSFTFDKCATYPVAYTSTSLFAQMYQKIGVGSPKNDPALTEDQQIDDSGTNVIENIVSKKETRVSDEWRVVSQDGYRDGGVEHAFRDWN